MTHPCESTPEWEVLRRKQVEAAFDTTEEVVEAEAEPDPPVDVDV
jgi:hypothetical protein